MSFYRSKLASLVVNEELGRARTSAGALQAYQEILMAFEVHQPAAVVDEEEPFTDPAERMSLRRAAR